MYVGHLPLALGVEIHPSDISSYLIETDVVETFEARPAYITNLVVWYKEPLLPPHEDVFALCDICVMKVRLPCLL